jgi:uncharacterized repeat protein (TIGR04138 family)
MELTVDELIYQVAEDSGRFRPMAFFLVLQALHEAQSRRKKVGHVSGRELLEALRALVCRQYGPMALTVMEHSGLKRTEDVGDLVFLMVGKGILKKQEGDGPEDFRDVYKFEEAFRYTW